MQLLLLLLSFQFERLSSFSHQPAVVVSLAMMIYSFLLRALLYQVRECIVDENEIIQNKMVDALPIYLSTHLPIGSRFSSLRAAAAGDRWRAGELGVG